MPVDATDPDKHRSEKAAAETNTASLSRAASSESSMSAGKVRLHSLSDGNNTTTNTPDHGKVERQDSGALLVRVETGQGHDKVSPDPDTMDSSTTATTNATASSDKYKDNKPLSEDINKLLVQQGGPDSQPNGQTWMSFDPTQTGALANPTTNSSRAELEETLKRSDSSTDLLHLTLHQCARDGSGDVMQRLLNTLQGNVIKKVNAHDEDDLSPLHYASRYNHHHIVKMLIEHGANVADVDSEGSTPLHFAARYKRMRIKTGDDKAPPIPESTVDNSVIIYLVHMGADINAIDIYGCTPLHFATMRGNEVAAQELLSCKRVNVEAEDKQTMTALHMAASHTETEICRMLLKANAKVRCFDEENLTPLHYACMEGSLEITKMLFEAAEARDGWVTAKEMLNDIDKEMNTPLHYAVENRSYDVAKLCLERGANVNATRQNYSMPLHLAAVAGDVSICQLLLDHKARKDALDINQSTPLHKAAAYNHTDVVAFLLDRGANIDKHDKDNFSPLLIAACNGHAETIKLLLDRGADPQQVDKNDKSVVFWAAEEDNLVALEVLLNDPKAGKMVDVTDRYENAPLHIAAQKGFINCVKILLEHKAKLVVKNEEERSPIHLAAENGRTQVVRELVKRDKMIINDEDEDSNTALHLAALAGHNKVVLALIEVGADIEARNSKLWTPLDCAAARGWTKTVRILLESDAPVDPLDKSKTTPLHLAASKGHPEVVTMLIKNHANVGQKDVHNQNCLDMAIQNGHKDVAMAIINSDKWQDALRSQDVDEHTGYRVTPIRKLIRKMPDVAEAVFNKCTTSENPADHRNFKITFNYEFLDDMYANWDSEGGGGDTLSVSTDTIYDEDNKLVSTAMPYAQDSKTLKENHPLSIMVTCNQEDLLAHPLITSLLQHKWNSMGRYVYYANLTTYCIFLVFLTSYILTTPAPHTFNNKTGLDEFDGSQCEKISQYKEAIGEPVIQHKLAEVARYIIILLSILNILREIFQIFNAKLNYLGWENLIEWTIYISALLLVIDFHTCQIETGLRMEWQWQLAAVSIFLAWMDLVLFMRKFPMFGIYVVMFTDVLITFIRFFPVFLLFITAFALSFHVLMSNMYVFESVGAAMLKSAAMMIGEMDYTDVFHAAEPGIDENDPENYPLIVFYPELSYTLFVIFVVLLTIIVMNLLVGLAVDDIKAVQEKAELTRLAMQVDLALSVEAILPQMIRRKFVVRCHTIYPNTNSSWVQKYLHLDLSFVSSLAITKALNPELDDMERLEENVERLQTTMTSLRNRVKSIESHNARVESMLEAVLNHLNVDFQEEDAKDETGESL